MVLLLGSVLLSLSGLVSAVTNCWTGESILPVLSLPRPSCAEQALTWDSDSHLAFRPSHRKSLHLSRLCVHLQLLRRRLRP